MLHGLVQCKNLRTSACVNNSCSYVEKIALKSVGHHINLNFQLGSKFLPAMVLWKSYYRIFNYSKNLEVNQITRTNCYWSSFETFCEKQDKTNCTQSQRAQIQFETYNYPVDFLKGHHLDFQQILVCIQILPSRHKHRQYRTIPVLLDSAHPLDSPITYSMP